MATEEAEVMVVSAVFKVAHDKLVAALRGDTAVTNTMRGNMKADLEKMQDEMESISAVLERWSIGEELGWLWLERVEHVAYDIWEMVDEIRTNKDAAPVCTVHPASDLLLHPLLTPV